MENIELLSKLSLSGPEPITSRLLTLPPELQEIIISFLVSSIDQEPRKRSPRKSIQPPSPPPFKPGLLNLKLTCSYFDNLIILTHPLLLILERDPYFKELQMFTCKDCLHLKPIHEFTTPMVLGHKGKNGTTPHARFCNDCGMKPLRAGEYPRFRRGRSVVPNKVVCVCCGKFQDHIWFDGVWSEEWHKWNTYYGRARCEHVWMFRKFKEKHCQECFDDFLRTDDSVMKIWKRYDKEKERREEGPDRIALLETYKKIDKKEVMMRREQRKKGKLQRKINKGWKPEDHPEDTQLLRADIPWAV